MTTATRITAAVERRTSVDPQIIGAWGAIIVAMIPASFAAILFRAALDAGMPALMTATSRLIIGFLLLTPLVLYRYRADLAALRRVDWMLGMFAGFWMCLHFSLIALSLENTRVAVMQVLVNTSPMIVAVLETVVLRTRLPRVVWVGLILTVLGGGIIGLEGILAVAPVLITPPGEVGFAITTGNPALGALFAVVSATAAAIYLTTGRKIRSRVSLVPYMWIVAGAGAVTGLSILALTGTAAFGYSAQSYVYVLLLALGPQLVTHSGINYAVAYLPATVVSISAQIVTLTAAVIAFLLYTEVPTLPEMVGGAIIAAGVVLAIIGQRRRRANVGNKTQTQ